MDDVPVYETSYEYRGERFRYRSADADYVTVWVDGDLSSARFPDAIETDASSKQAWVKLPRTALDAAYDQKVYAMWHRTPVSIVSRVRRGVNRGLLNIEYDGNRPDEARAAGFSGDQYNGWSAEVPPSEIEDVRVEIKRYPRVPR